MIGIATISSGGTESGEIKICLSQDFGGEVGGLGRLSFGFLDFSLFADATVENILMRQGIKTLRQSPSVNGDAVKHNQLSVRFSGILCAGSETQKMPPPQGELQTLDHSSGLRVTHPHENVTQLSHKCDLKDMNRKNLLVLSKSLKEVILTRLAVSPHSQGGRRTRPRTRKVELPRFVSEVFSL
jgi:hypothetical protein